MHVDLNLCNLCSYTKGAFNEKVKQTGLKLTQRLCWLKGLFMVLCSPYATYKRKHNIRVYKNIRLIEHVIQELCTHGIVKIWINVR